MTRPTWVDNEWNISHLWLPAKNIARLPWQRNIQQAVQAAGAEHGRIDKFWTVGGGYNEDIPPCLQTIHLRQKLVHLWHRWVQATARG